MILIVDERTEVVKSFESMFAREGVVAAGIAPSELENWTGATSAQEIDAVDAILLGNIEDRARVAKGVRSRLRTPLIALNEQRSLDETLDLFAAGADDVIRKPVHVREILARMAAIRRRHPAAAQADERTGIRIFGDGRDPEVGGEVLRLPRRELRILEFLIAKRGSRVTKTQIFNAVYGLFNDDIDESIIESHISKLRKRLRCRLGRDPIDSQRFLGYRIDLRGC